MSIDQLASTTHRTSAHPGFSLFSFCPYSLSIDIDVLDPTAAPATGTPETGGWTSRELRKIIRGLEGLDIVGKFQWIRLTWVSSIGTFCSNSTLIPFPGADIVEVAPPYDTAASLTQMVAADLVWDILGIMVKRGPLLGA